MQDAFTTVVIVVVVAGVAIAILTLLTGRRSHDEIGRDGLQSAARSPREGPLRDDVRTVVQARNRRRVRAGEPPLDVDAEIDRELRELT